VERHDDRISLTLETDGRSTEIQASHVFVATGRKPNTDNLGLETIGVEVSEKGYVKVDDRLLSSVNGIWVAGDIRGGPQFTHTAWDDYRILLSQMAGDGSRMQHRIVPYAVFTDPQLGRVGMSEGEARRSGRPIEVARFDVRENSKAREIGETAGFIKVVADEETHRILGAAVLAPEGAELVHIYVDLMNADAPYTVIRDAIHVHPTLAEAMQSAVSRLVSPRS
jgi:pyruvate/2-oxoglutarate dehydrogenase complex dihydrolipoamide dehydrogenase (E3) component